MFARRARPSRSLCAPLRATLTVATTARPARFTIYGKGDSGECHLCLVAKCVLQNAIRDHQRPEAFAIEEIDVSGPGNEHWHKLYRNDIPVVHLNGKEVFRHRVDAAALQKLLAALQ